MPGIRPIEFDRQAALDAVVEAFWSGGFAGTNLTGLVEATGVARQSLYNTFGDKRSMFLAALRRYSEERLARHASALDGDPAMDRLIAFVETWRHRRARSSGRGCLISLAMGEVGQADPAVAEVAAHHARGLADLMAASLQRAGVEATSARRLAGSLVTTSFGIATLARQRGTDEQIEAATETAVAMLWASA
ncbi:MAG: TetR/AcrR family transcriptional regulator [Acidobacteriota bacterium]